ncbi:hypothetical protein N7497_010366 [Penicillium chrysogenum]|nr:hypothetical protein N7497_010366 [Penicillium chrysogenum]
MPTGLMTSQQVNDELMSRRVCNYQYAAGITIIPNSHLNGLDSSRQGTTRNGCTLNRACVGLAKLRSTEIAENRISGKNAKSLWLARLGYSNLPVKIFARGRAIRKDQFSP